MGVPEAGEQGAGAGDAAAVTSPSDGSAIQPCPCDKSFSAEAQATIDRMKSDLDASIASNQSRYDARIAEYQRKNWAIDTNHSAFKELQTMGDALKQQKEDLENALNECACFGDDLLTLANVVYNEAGAFSMNAKTAVAYAYLNRTGGTVRAPQGTAEISHYKTINQRLNSMSETDRFSFMPDFTESIRAACRRLRDQNPQANDPTNGATHWVSPDALSSSANGCPSDRFARNGRCFPNWTDPRWEEDVVEMQAEGVPAGEFLFFKGVRY
jgi:hypothetical protein